MKRFFARFCLLFACVWGVISLPGEALGASRGKRHSQRSSSGTVAAATAKPSKAAVKVEPALIREAQNTLTELGFYFGEVNGEVDEETRGAVRRFQAFKKLAATGELGEATLAALRVAAREAEAAPRQNASALSAALRSRPSSPEVAMPQRPQQPPALERLDNPLAPEEGGGGSSRSAFALRSPSRGGQPPLGGQVPEEQGYASFLRGTPYAKLPLSAQVGLVRNVQAALARERFFPGGAVDGVPSVATEEALSRFQATRGMPVSGRIDQATLQALGLIPVQRAARAPVGSLSRPPMVRGVAPSRSASVPEAGVTIQGASSEPPRTLGPAGKMIVPRRQSSRP